MPIFPFLLPLVMAFLPPGSWARDRSSGGQGPPQLRCKDKLGRPVRGVDWANTDLTPIFEALVTEKVFLNDSQIRRKYETQVNAVLKRLKFKVGAAAFVLGAKKVHGTWDGVLKAYGHDPLDYRLAYDPTTPDEIVLAIKALYKAKVPLNAGAVANDHSRDSKVIIRKAIKKIISAEALYFRALKEFGSWPKALEASDLPVEEIIKENRMSPADWDENFIFAVIDLLAENFPDLNLSELNNHADKIRDLAYGRWRRIVTISTLSRHASRVFGSWPAALKARGLDISAIRWTSRVTWSEKLVLKILEALKAGKFNPNLESLRMRSGEMAAYLEETIGIRVGPAGLHAAAKRYFGSWLGALDRAGFDITRMRTRLHNFRLSDDFLADVLYRLHKERINLQLENFLTNRRVLKVTLDYYTMALSPSAIYFAAVDIHRTWKAALEAANVPAVLTRRTSVTSDIVLMPHVISYEQRGDGTSQRVVEYGEPSVNPEDALIAEQDAGAVHEAIANLNNERRTIAMALLEYLEEHDGLEEKTDVAAFLGEKLGRPIEWAVVTQVLEALSGEIPDYQP